MAAKRLFVSRQSRVLGSCDLCLEPSAELTDAVTVENDLGHQIVFAACARCSRAVRRLVAVIGPDSNRLTGAVTTLDERAADGLRPRLDSQPQLIQTFLERVSTAGRSYEASVYACARTDATWAAWLVFVDQATGETRSTDVETTQPDLPAARYWATGLEPTYLEGAFGRATNVNAPIPPALLSV